MPMNDFVSELGFVALGTRLRRLGERLQADVQDILTALDVNIPASQLPMLAMLRARSPVGISALAGGLGVSQPAATRMVGLLATAGLARVTVTEGDQRGRSVVLTARGRQKIGRVMADVAPVIGRSLQAMAHQANGNLLQQLAAFETALDQQTLAQRFTAGRKT